MALLEAALLHVLRFLLASLLPSSCCPPAISRTSLTLSLRCTHPFLLPQNMVTTLESFVTDPQTQAAAAEYLDAVVCTALPADWGQMCRTVRAEAPRRPAPLFPCGRPLPAAGLRRALQ